MQLLHRSPTRISNTATRCPSFPAATSPLLRLLARRSRIRVAHAVFVALALVRPTHCTASDAPTALAFERDRSFPYAGFIDGASQRFGIPPTWIRAVMDIESAGHPHAVSAKGARGLMQIMPHTWTYLRYRYRLGADIFDPRDNILGGAAYLHELFARFGAAGALAAYNAGPTSFGAYLAGLRPLSEETRSYVERLARVLPDISIAGMIEDSATTIDSQRGDLFAATTAAVSPSKALHDGRVRAGFDDSTATALTPRSTGLFAVIETPTSQ